MMIMGFVDIQPKISDPSIFDVPRECKDAKPHPEKVMTAMTQARLGKRIDWEDDRGGGGWVNPKLYFFHLLFIVTE